MSDVVERYLTVGLRLGRHVDGFVDAYYGPDELKAAVEEEELGSAETLLEEAIALERDLPTAGLEPHRQAWLADQVGGIRVAARVLAGEALSYSDEVEGCYGVRPDAWSEDLYREAHERLDELLPPGDSLFERFEGWRERLAVPPAKMVPALLAAVEVSPHPGRRPRRAAGGRGADRRGGPRRALVGVQLLPRAPTQPRRRQLRHADDALRHRHARRA